MKLPFGLFIKESAVSGFVQCGQGGGLQMRTSALFGVKNSGFFEIYGGSARIMGEKGQFFAILCGRLLWMAPKERME